MNPIMRTALAAPLAPLMLAVMCASSPALAQEPATAAPALSAGSPLVSAFRAAKQTDPQYRAALSERTVNESAALGARLAYTPSLSYNSAQSEVEAATRNTLQISQPLLSADRFLTLREAEPRTLLADATMVQREQDLAQRLLKAVTEIVRAREGIRVNEYRISLLDEQAKRAKRMYELGEGTITDERDTAVRREQARAAQLGLLSRLRVAENQFFAIVGARAPAEAFRIAEVPRPIALEQIEHYLDGGQVTNPVLITARQQERLAEIARQRSKAVLLPTVSAVAQRSESAGLTSNYVGVTINLPLQSQSITQVMSAGAQAERARELRRDTEQKLKVDIERLRELVDSGQQELAVRKDAILAAKLAVQANLKSQQGGIRTSVDVLNAIQSLADVRNEYTSAAATLAENYLSLLLQSAFDPTDALEKVQLSVFAN